MGQMPDLEHDVLEAARDFLSAIGAVSEPAAERLARVKLALDRLAYLQHFVADNPDPPDHPDAPAQDYFALRGTIASQFPRLGCYTVPQPVTRIGNEDLEVADSVDDMAVIASELESLLWRSEHTTLADALWHFRNGYLRHWGEHLRGLQLYLHRATPPGASDGKSR